MSRKLVQPTPNTEAPLKSYFAVRKSRNPLKIGQPKSASKRQHSPEAQPDDSQLDKWEPHNWRRHLANIRLMREEHSPAGWQPPVAATTTDNATPLARYRILLAALLSSQTRDAISGAAVDRLQRHGLTPANILATSDAVLEQLIAPVSFHKNKAKYIRRTTQLLVDNYGGDIPSSYAELLKLPGIGPKMAHICMQMAWDRCTGIAVDTHVHRVANRLRWVPSVTADANATRQALERWVPANRWQEVDELLFWFGQNECTQLQPNCGPCRNRSVCPFVQDAE